MDSLSSHSYFHSNTDDLDNLVQYIFHSGKLMSKDIHIYCSRDYSVDHLNNLG